MISFSQTSKDFRTIVRFCRQYLWTTLPWRHRLWIMVAFACLLVSKVLSAAAPQFLALTVASLAGSSLPTFSLYLGLYCLSLGLSQLFQNLNTAIFAPASAYAMKQLIGDTFSNILDLSYEFHVLRQTGKLVRSLDRGRLSVASLTQMVLFNTLPLTIDLTLAAGILAFQFNALYSLLVVVMVVLYVVVTFGITEWRNKIRQKENEYDSLATGHFSGALENYETVKYFGNEAWEVEHLNTAMSLYGRAFVNTQASLSFLNVAQQVTLVSGLGILLWLTGRSHSAAELVLVLAYVQNLQRPLNFIGTAYRMIRQGLTDMEVIFDLRDAKREITDRPHAHGLYAPRQWTETLAADVDTLAAQDRAQLLRERGGAGAGTDLDADANAVELTVGDSGLAGRADEVLSDAEVDPELVQARSTVAITLPEPLPLEPEELAGSIAFEGVSFQYPNGHKILKDVSFFVPPGKIFALVGPSGSGKSSLVRLLFRLYEPTSGRIRIDGQDVTQVQLHSLRSAVAIVPQSIALFNNTIRYNLEYGRRGAPMAEMREAARIARILDYIEHQSDQFETRVSNLRLSGGEKQRLGVARALLKRPRIFVFDEATSALDTIVESQLQAEIAQATRGTTSLVIAHRLSTVVHADCLIVLKHGQVVERGTHHELLEMKGIYAELWRCQQEERAVEQAQQRLQSRLHLISGVDTNPGLVGTLETTLRPALSGTPSSIPTEWA